MQNFNETLGVLRKLFPEIHEDFESLTANRPEMNVETLVKAFNDPAKRLQVRVEQARKEKDLNDAKSLELPNFKALPAPKRALVGNWLSRLKYLDEDYRILEISLAILPMNSPIWETLINVLADEPPSPLLDIALVALVPTNFEFIAEDVVRNVFTANQMGAFNRDLSLEEGLFIHRAKAASDKDKKALLAWLRMLEIQDYPAYQKVLAFAEKLPSQDRRWNKVLNEVTFTMGPQRSHHLVLRAVQRFLDP